ncbi:MAG: PEP-CTERM sorting domain-containing protein [Pirellulaceae bacterium]|nr:PEP-CTERM sorting domain-containing protein [Pirellulaceae bacterium]
MKRVVTAVFLACLLVLTSPNSTSAAITLSGSQYFEDFNGIGSGVPTGISLGQVISDPYGVARDLRKTAGSYTHVSWDDTIDFDFRNSASPTGTDTSTNPDRLIAVRQGVSSGVTTPSFLFSFSKTEEFTDFKLDFDVWVLQKGNRNTTWTVRWATQSSLLTFNTITTFTPTTAGKLEFRNLSLGSAFANSTEAKHIQIVATGISSSGGTRDVFGLDNFRLKFTPAAVPEPSSGVLVGLVAIAGLSFRRKRSK